ncbi:MAG: hypothetical protein H6707_01730 [Deltaproteobacteria bacterium]|nr:hypothetical protein [Deltaproteobacteria bacterium]
MPALSRVLAALSLLLLSAPVAAKVELNLSGRIQSDLRFRVINERAGQWYSPIRLDRGVARNENIGRFRLEADGGRFFGLAELDFVWIGLDRDFDTLADLSLREKNSPYRLEAQALYIEATDIFVDGLDLRIGQQKVTWGKGDQFNPTNTLNPLDLEDVLLFGELVANMMVKVDYNFGANWSLSAVLVPVFKPALLPSSASLGLVSVERLPWVEDDVRWRIHAERELAKYLGYPTAISATHIVEPETSFKNMQGALRVAGMIGDHDIALSYYVGRHTIPTPLFNYSRLTNDPQCNPLDPNDCIKGLLTTETTLGFPRMQVVGLNMAGQLNLLGWLSSKIKPIGYRIEAGVFFPQVYTQSLVQEEMDFGFYTQPKGEYDYINGRRPHVVDSTPFAKWVIGLDYTFNRYFYLNAQWVHGMPDEFGAGDFLSGGKVVRDARPTISGPTLLACAVADAKRGEHCIEEVTRPRLGDYLVLGGDIKLLADKLLLRLFMLLDLNGYTTERFDDTVGQRVSQHHSPFSSEGFSAVFFPELSYNFGFGLELFAGALFNLGKSYTKFGDPASGGSKVFTRARFSF